jgi:hypothetical protein
MTTKRKVTRWINQRAFGLGGIGNESPSAFVKTTADKCRRLLNEEDLGGHAGGVSIYDLQFAIYNCVVEIAALRSQ